MHYLSFDTETTGFDRSAKIIELSVIYFTSGEVVEEWSQLFWPGDIDWEATQGAFDINGLSREKLQGSPTFAECLGEVVTRLEGERVWVAHNTPFDIRMLQQEFGRLDMPMPEPKYALDTMMLDVACNRHERRRTLSFVAPRWGVKLDGAHRAAADSIACGEVLWAMLQSGKLPSDIEYVFDVQTGNRARWDSSVKRKYG